MEEILIQEYSDFDKNFNKKYCIDKKLKTKYVGEIFNFNIPLNSLDSNVSVDKILIGMSAIERHFSSEAEINLILTLQISKLKDYYKFKEICMDRSELISVLKTMKCTFNFIISIQNNEKTKFDERILFNYYLLATKFKSKLHKFNLKISQMISNDDYFRISTYGFIQNMTNGKHSTCLSGNKSFAKSISGFGRLLPAINISKETYALLKKGIDEKIWLEIALFDVQKSTFDSAESIIKYLCHKFLFGDVVSCECCSDLRMIAFSTRSFFENIKGIPIIALLLFALYDYHMRVDSIDELKSIIKEEMHLARVNLTISDFLEELQNEQKYEFFKIHSEYERQYGSKIKTILVNNSGKNKAEKIKLFNNSLKKISKECSYAKDQSVKNADQEIKALIKQAIIYAINKYKGAITNQLWENILKYLEGKNIICNKDIKQETIRDFCNSLMDIYSNYIIHPMITQELYRMISVAEGMLQLVENSLFYAGGGIFSVHILSGKQDKEILEKYYPKYFDESSKKDFNNAGYFMEIMLSDISGTDICQKFFENIEDRINDELKETMEKFTIKSFFMPTSDEISAWNRYYEKPEYITYHYGLEIFDSIVESYGGIFSIMSGERGSYCNIDRKEETTGNNIKGILQMNGTSYRILLPIDSMYSSDKNIYDSMFSYDFKNFVRNKGYDITLLSPIEIVKITDGRDKHDKIKNEADRIYSILSKDVNTNIPIYVIELSAETDIECEIKALILGLIHYKQTSIKEHIYLAILNCTANQLLETIRVLSLHYNKIGNNSLMKGIQIYLRGQRIGEEIIFYGNNLRDIKTNLSKTSCMRGIMYDNLRVVDDLLSRDQYMESETDTSSFIPFELLIENPSNKKNLFINTVEEILGENLQLNNSFGCKIDDCHVNIGAKTHVSSFIEAELLFHNSYYNRGFAFLTAKEILKNITEEQLHKKDFNVILVGYESYCELYLCETTDLLREQNVNADYCICEILHSQKWRIRKHNKIQVNDDTLVVYITPIVTTLTTFEKLISKFMLEFNIDREIRSIYFSLILAAGSDKNDYWEIDMNKNQLIPKSGVFKHLNGKEVYYFTMVSNLWKNPIDCEECFPSLGNPKDNQLLCEKPLFEINRASVVPMLQLGVNKPIEPLRNADDLIIDGDNSNALNIKRVIKLSEEMYHKHIQRNGSHFQYYFDTEQYFENNKNDIQVWLKDVVKPSMGENSINIKKDSHIILDIIVAPRHYSNAGFVNSVNKYVFNNMARVLYFDVQKEFRDNIKAKYSDFSRFIQNLKNSNQKIDVRMHYVDDTIYLSNNHQRSKNLMKSIIDSEETNNLKIHLYHSVILLVGRSSVDTKRFLIENASRFFEYVHLSISPMRTYDDACTLCSLVMDYNKMAKFAATNQMSIQCKEVIKRHEETSAEQLNIKDKANSRNKLQMVIVHLINERLQNNIIFLKKDTAVNVELEESVYKVLSYAYKSIDKIIGKIEIGNTYSRIDMEIAFIKAITRPFFCFHIRKKQAAFTLCLRLIDEIIKKEKLTPDELKKLKVLVNALADMNAYYIIRGENLKLLLNKANNDSSDNEQFSKYDYMKAVKKLITVWNAGTKALLVENILIKGGENGFFGSTTEMSSGIELIFADWMVLYVENNTILSLGLQLGSEKSYDKDFVKIMELNRIADREKIGKKYRDLQEMILNHQNNNVNKYYCQISQNIQELKDIIKTTKSNDTTVNYEASKVYIFIENTQDKTNIDDKYIILNNDRNGQGLDLEDSVKNNIDSLLSEICIADTVYLKRGCKNCIIKFEYMTANNVSQDGKNELREKYQPVYIMFDLSEEMGIEITEKMTDKIINNMLPDLFFIKILLSLRNCFIELVKRDFSTNAIMDSVYLLNEKRALEIAKASRHDDAEYYEGININDISEFLRLNAVNVNNDIILKKGKILFDKYIQLLANNFISSIYRKINVNDLPSDSYSVECWSKEENNALFNIFFKNWDSARQVYTYEMYALNRGFRNSNEKDNTVPDKGIATKLIFENFVVDGKAIQWNIMDIQRCSAISNIMLIIILLSCNAAYHFHVSNTENQQSSICEVYIRPDEDGYLSISNKVTTEKGETARKMVETAVCKAKKSILSRPWEDNGKKSISLWTLNKYCQKMLKDRGKEPKEKPMVIEQNGEMFVVKLPIVLGCDKNNKIRKDAE